LPEAMTKPEPCQVRSKTESPCPRRAEVEILGVAFCGPCARQQEEYFAIGELTHEDGRDFCGESLTEAKERTRRARAGSTDLRSGCRCGHFGLDALRNFQDLSTS
jgi:hypothetical protein